MALTIPNIFKRKQIIPSAGINENYEAIRSYIDTLEVDIASGAAIDNGSITTAKIADGAVTTVKLADGAVTDAKISLSGGWLIGNGTWTYASATTMTATGDYTGFYYRGRKLRLVNNGTTKYFVVVNSVFGSGTTTVYVYAGTSYTLANFAITDVYVGLSDTLPAFPSTFTFTPSSVVGWSSIASETYLVAFNARLMHLYIDITGTSNATTADVTLPSDMSTTPYREYVGTCKAFDNGSAVPNPIAYWLVVSGSPPNNNVYAKPSWTTNWTSSGTKTVNINIWAPF